MKKKKEIYHSNDARIFSKSAVHLFMAKLKSSHYKYCVVESLSLVSIWK